MREIGGKRMKGVCLNCRQHFEAVTERGVYCSGRCRAEASRKRRAKTLNAALGEIEHGLVKARRVLAGEGEDFS